MDELARGEAEDSEEARETAGSGRLARFEPPPGTRDATIFERAAAFGLDLFALFLIFTSLSPLLPLGLGDQRDHPAEVLDVRRQAPLAHERHVPLRHVAAEGLAA